jgi:hypothetical protein
MSQIFYSEVDKNLQLELNARGRAGIYDRSETALRFMTEKIANVLLVAYEGNKRDKTKIVHELGGRKVIQDDYQPGGFNGFLVDRTYTLQESRWIADPGSVNNAVSTGNTSSLFATVSSSAQTLTNRSKRIPPFITQASLQINDNSKGTTNKATINITIPDPVRDLNFMESVYARPGRYCLLRIEHPNSALMTLTGSQSTNGMLNKSALPNRELIKQRYPEADQEYDELRKMNKIQFEGLITSFEYSYNQDGTVTMTIYILGTSQTYTDMSMIMQTSNSNSNSIEQASGSAFYNTLYKEVDEQYKADVGISKTTVASTIKARPGFSGKKITNKNKDNQIIPNPYAFNSSKDPLTKQENSPSWYVWQNKSLKETSPQYITLNWLINFINDKVLSKLKDVVAAPKIYCDWQRNGYSNYYEYLCSADPENVLLLSNSTGNNENNWQFKTDMYGNNRYLTIKNKNEQPNFYNYYQNSNKQRSEELKTEVTGYEKLGQSGNILISMNLIKEIQDAALNDTKVEFTVGKFFEKLSAKISTATGGAINLKLVTDPEDLTILYYRDINWLGKISPINPYNLPMYATHPNGSIVREFKLSSKLPSNAQSLMYSINSANKVSESQLGPYISFMYNNGTATRSPQTTLDPAGNIKELPGEMIETTTYGGSKELTERLSREYLALHIKYRDELLKARIEFGLNPKNEQKRAELQVALQKYIQYPKPTIQQTNSVSAPTFPIEAEFTIDGINGLRYGDLIDFPVLPEKYQKNTTFTIKGMNHSISTTGEWTTQISCLMRPKFD